MIQNEIQKDLAHFGWDVVWHEVLALFDQKWDLGGTRLENTAIIIICILYSIHELFLFKESKCHCRTKRYDILIRKQSSKPKVLLHTRLSLRIICAHRSSVPLSMQSHSFCSKHLQNYNIPLHASDICCLKCWLAIHPIWRPWRLLNFGAPDAKHRHWCREGKHLQDWLCFCQLRQEIIFLYRILHRQYIYRECFNN